MVSTMHFIISSDRVRLPGKRKGRELSPMERGKYEHEHARADSDDSYERNDEILRGIRGIRDYYISISREFDREEGT